MATTERISISKHTIMEYQSAGRPICLCRCAVYICQSSQPRLAPKAFPQIFMNDLFVVQQLSQFW